MFRSCAKSWRTATLASIAFAILLAASDASARQSPAVPAPATPHTLTGIDVLELEHFAPLRGKRVGLITNQTGVDSQGRRTIDVLKSAPGVKLVALFSPEHGIAGRADSSVSNDTDAKTGLTIYSLYGTARRPTPEMLTNLDALVFDIQDAGVRFYTFTTTMAYCMEEAAKAHIAYYVLDRPNPLGGEIIEGPTLDPDKLSFVGYFPMPIRYAMTIGELAQMFNAENKMGADLHVIAMKNWHRSEPYNQAGLPWIAPSPNLRSLTEAYLYPGIEILQAGGVSVGRGTDTPFEILGAPWIDSKKFATALEHRKISGVEFSATQFTPTQDLYAGQLCQGVKIRISPKGELRSMRMGMEIEDVLHRMYPQNFHVDKTITLIGNQATVDAIASGESPAKIVKSWTPALENFRATRAKYLLYQ
ncbi:MAG: exo-beta-N-acetylmuramidase NamZ family protein [Candidatus Acidiferrales bacterium]